MKATEIRKSNMDIGKLYFWTATINNWNKLLEGDQLKEVIISSLKYLAANKKIEIYRRFKKYILNVAGRVS